MVGVPGFVPMGSLNSSIVLDKAVEQTGPATIVFDVHGRPDFWRFSEEAMRSVVFEGMTVLDVHAFLFPPRLIGVAQMSTKA
jgi:hypothetical protein